MTKAYSIALGSIIIECNHLGGTPADLRRFEETELRRGSEVLAQTDGVVGGALEVLSARSVAIRPTLVASACPSGPLTADCYRRLKTELLGRLQETLPVDGVLLPLHGAAAADGVGDLEGDLVEAVRGLIGPEVPVVVTLDLHADVTEAMVRHADAILGWETYPHRDTFETGRRGARMLLDVLDGRCRPAMAMAKVPLLVGALRGHTEGEGPFADVMRAAKSLEGSSGVVSTSVFLVHPYLDLPGMGGGALVITHDDPLVAESHARRLAEMYWQRRFDLEPPLCTPAEAVKKGLDIEGGPVLLVETADCCGGGAAGDSVASLRALLAADLDAPALVPVADPEVAALCHRQGPGGVVTAGLGHKIDPKWGQPVRVTGRVARLSDGRFRYTGGVWEGQQGDMGPSAVLEIGPVRVLVSTRGTYDWADEQFCAVGLEPRRAKFVVAKNPMNYRMAYGELMRAAFILDTPGPTPASMRGYRYRNVARPYFPADPDIPGLVPTVFGHGPRKAATSTS